MLDGDKSREQLLSELGAIRRRVVELESLDAARTRAARMLMEAEIRYNRLFDSAPAALFRATPSGDLLDVNAALADLLGYDDPARLLTHSMDDLCVAPGEFWRGIEHPNGKAACRLRKANGQIVSVVVRGALVCDEIGTPLYYEGSFVPAPAGETIADAGALFRRRIEAMARLSEALGRFDTPAPVAQIALAELLETAHGEWAAVVLFGDDEDVTVLAERRRDGAEIGPDLAFPLGWFDEGQVVLRNGDNLHIDDVRLSDERSPIVQSLREAGVGSFLSVPLSMGKKTGWRHQRGGAQAGGLHSGRCGGYY